MGGCLCLLRYTPQVAKTGCRPSSNRRLLNKIARSPVNIAHSAISFIASSWLLYFRYSAMNAGKSTSLLQIAYNYEEQGQRGAVLPPPSTTAKAGTPSPRAQGLRRQADTFDSATDFGRWDAGPYPIWPVSH